MSTAPQARMGWEDETTTLMPNELLTRLLTQTKPAQIHPRLRTRDEHASDLLREEPPSIVGPPLVMSRARAQWLAVVALVAAFALGFAATLGF